MMLPTDDGKYIVAHAVVKDEEIDSLNDAIIELPEQDGKKPNLKFPIVLVRDIDTIVGKLLDDLNELEDKDYLDHIHIATFIKMVNRRFGHG